MNKGGFFGHPHNGLYLAIDGIGCCGKSTQVRQLEQGLRRNYPNLELLITKEPGGTEKCNQIRTAIVSKCGEELLPWVEVNLFAASRGQAIGTLIEPALERGAVVLSDRCFLSSLCYQGFGLDLGWQNVLKANENALREISPDVIIFPDIDYDLAMTRLFARDGRDNVYDQKICNPEYFKRVREGYKFFAKRIHNFVYEIDGSLPVETQAELIWDRVDELIKDRELTREFSIRRERG